VVGGKADSKQLSAVSPTNEEAEAPAKASESPATKSDHPPSG
jgi:hypothetical protein